MLSLKNDPSHHLVLLKTTFLHFAQGHLILDERLFETANFMSSSNPLLNSILKDLSLNSFSYI